MSGYDPYETARKSMVSKQLRARGIHDRRVLDAMLRLPRHRFMPQSQQAYAYADCACPIGSSQTISQPYIVALMTQALDLRGTERVLEIGTGSGYQTALLCMLAAHVYSLERIARLARRAANTLHDAGFQNFDIHVGDGSQGLADMAPFDAIIVTAAAPDVPAPLISQLSSEGGRMIVPVGDDEGQYLELIKRSGERWKSTRIASVRFVPLVGRFGFSETEANGEDDSPPTV
jgi:protein-L-isoaspartate(D-aspartate) O-methyltransferase